MKRKEFPVFKNVSVVDVAAEGKSIAKIDNLVIFIPNAVPGDIIDIQVTRKKKSYFEGRAIHFHKYSDKRAEPVCEHFGVCGGCKRQDMVYEAQLYYKQKQVEDNLKRIGKVDLSSFASNETEGLGHTLRPPLFRGEEPSLEKPSFASVPLSKMGVIFPIIPSKKTEYYRNKLEFTFSNKRWLTDDEIILKEHEFAKKKQIGSPQYAVDSHQIADCQLMTADLFALGFHIPGRFDKVLDIKHCHLQKDPSNAIRLAVNDYATENKLSFFDIRRQEGFCRNLIIRTSPTPDPSLKGGESQRCATAKAKGDTRSKSPYYSGEIMVIVSFFYEDVKKREGILNHLAVKFPEITSLMYVINPKKNDTISDLEVQLFKGKDHIFEEMEGLKFRIGPKSFYQTNSEQAYELYKVTREFAQLTGDKIVYDLYTGSGTIANFIARQAKKVIGIEFLSEAVCDAKINSDINGITNTSFYAGDIKDIFNDDLIKKNGTPDIIITDPPRAGMHKDVVEKILETAPKRVVYVSCNPATQARDIALMTEKYKVEKIQPLDMFPHTPHVENVVMLRLF